MQIISQSMAFIVAKMNNLSFTKKGAKKFKHKQFSEYYWVIYFWWSKILENLLKAFIFIKKKRTHFILEYIEWRMIHWNTEFCAKDFLIFICELRYSFQPLEILWFGSTRIINIRVSALNLRGRNKMRSS